VSSLLAAGADPAKESLLCEPLSHAADPAIVKMLLDAKADASIRSALKASCQQLQPESVRMLLAARASIDGRGSSDVPLKLAIAAEHTGDRSDDLVSIISQLLDAGASLSYEWTQSTALHMCAESRSPNAPAAAALLLARHLELLEQRDARGMTPLMLAAVNSNAGVTAVLLRAGADPWDSPAVLLAVCPYRPPDDSMGEFYPEMHDVLRLLLRAGADLTRPCGSGHTVPMLLLPCSMRCDAPGGRDCVYLPDHAAAVLLRDVAEAVLAGEARAGPRDGNGDGELDDAAMGDE
jgi:ankyrin repeat protein